jgi:LmbE family N-acetylglucosaminyl deacetylase
MTTSPDHFDTWLKEFASMVRRDLPTPAASEAPVRPAPAADAPVCLIMAPHPDDECIVGPLALRLRQEAGWRVVNVAVTLGSNLARRPERWQELTQACAFLGFDLELPAEGGLEQVTPKARSQDPAAWALKRDALVAVIRRYKPALILLPHAQDGSATHKGVHLVVRDAIEAAGQPVLTANCEYWATMDEPNLMVTTSHADTATIIRALACHVGEVSRNPYHLRLPAWLMDGVRRGGELIGGAGTTPPDADFATLYQRVRWTGEQWTLPEAGCFWTEGQKPTWV